MFEKLLLDYRFAARIAALLCTLAVGVGMRIAYVVGNVRLTQTLSYVLTGLVLAGLLWLLLLAYLKTQGYGPMLATVRVTSLAGIAEGIGIGFIAAIVINALIPG